MSLTGTVRRRFRCRGVVQGVGLRPAIYRLATDHGLGGFVRNDVDGVTIEVEGAAPAVHAFETGIAAVLPPLARLDELRVEDAPLHGEHAFVVAATTDGPRAAALAPPDVALCAHCRREIADPTDRRHHHPFATCTDCGPRYTIVRTLPYDRERTAMAAFAMCPACAREYADPANRRFHAEPICCPECGPELRCEDPEGGPVARRAGAMAAARAALVDGAIVAVKGLGGFQLACRADDAEAVARLRTRKHRAGKPFAVMVPDLATADRFVALRDADRALLTSPAGPIVLLPQRAAAPVAAGVADGTGDLGVLLPTTPLHVELFDGARFDALVMTSGNRSDEPICTADDDARERLRGIADLFLLHDRAIVRRVDDSVVRAMRDAAAPCVIRRSRGYVPTAVPLPIAAPEPILALGGHLQVTACIGQRALAFPSQHVGDLDTAAARAFLREVANGLERFLAVTPRVVAADLHPDYPSGWIATALARDRGGRVLRVQHHLAHAAAVLAEHGALPVERDDQVLALVLDGTGYGPDGTAWGCEWIALAGDLRWRRAAHGTGLPLVGGERAVREPWRIAAAVLATSDHADWLSQLPFTGAIDPARVQAVVGIAGNGTIAGAHGAGRLFEAAGALLAGCTHNRYEGEAALRLEALAAESGAASTWTEVALDPAATVLPQQALLVAAARRYRAGEPPADVARGLFATFASLAVELTLRVLPRGQRRVALAGGCLCNRLLVADLTAGLAACGITALRARSLPPGDGGLAFGQVALAALAVARGAEDRLASPSQDPE